LKARKKPGGSPPPLRRYPDEKHMDENAVFCDNVMNGGGDVEINVTRSTASSPIREAEPTILVSPGANSNPDAITIVRINSTGNGLTNHSTSNGVEVLPKFEKEALTGDVESGKSYQAQTISLLSRVVIQAFTLTFLAEWGDRSQLTTIILAAREDVYGVTLGGVLGHSLCTGLAVIGGRFIAQRISVRTVTITGGIVFLVFACTALLFDPADS
ncbi:hypothetical protein M8J76_004441, partial [Diaphorina citri]